MAKINIEFDGKIYSVDESTLTPLASPIIQTLVGQLAGTGAVIKFGGSNYEVDVNKLASARNVLTGHFSAIAGTDSKITVAGTEYGLSKTKLQGATDRMNDTLSGMSEITVDPESPDAPPEPVIPGSQGLEYELNEDGTSYSLISRGTCADTDIVIPSTHKGLPVTQLKPRKEWIDEKGYVYEVTFGTFEDCTNITSVTIPNSVTSIAENAFKACSSLTSVTIGNSVTSIGDGTFEECSRLTNVTIGNSVTSIGDDAFYKCFNLTSVTIPNSVTSIGKSAFAYCSSITSVTIGNSVTSIGSRAFAYLTKLKSVTIPDSVTSIGDDAFSLCTSLTSVTIGNGVTSIDDDEFKNCTALTSITVDENNTVYKSTDGNLYSKDGTTLIKYAIGKTNTSFTIPDSVTSINSYAFWHCSSITSVTIPDSVTSIGSYAFEGCSGLTSVTIPDSVTSIGGGAFRDCRDLTSIIFNGTVAQWNSVSLDIYFNPFYGVSTTYVQCTDGQVTL